MMNLQLANKSWTLFLDRDGVLNHEKKQDYIRNSGEFIFYDGVVEALCLLNGIFGTIVIVTNQKGVGKGWMTLQDLEDIHHNMLQMIKQAGGSIAIVSGCFGWRLNPQTRWSGGWDTNYKPIDFWFSAQSARG